MTVPTQPPQYVVAFGDGSLQRVKAYLSGGHIVLGQYETFRTPALDEDDEAVLYQQDARRSGVLVEVRSWAVWRAHDLVDRFGSGIIPAQVFTSRDEAAQYFADSLLGGTKR